MAVMLVVRVLTAKVHVVTLRLAPVIPSQVAIAQFPSVKAATEAVIEILSKGYEKKDTDVSLPFYLAQGIPDIVIFDPATNRVSHFHDGQTDEHNSPIQLTFACGCRATV